MRAEPLSHSILAVGMFTLALGALIYMPWWLPLLPHVSPMTLLLIPIALFAYGFLCSLVRFWPEFIALMDGQGKEY